MVLTLLLLLFRSVAFGYFRFLWRCRRYIYDGAEDGKTFEDLLDGLPAVFRRVLIAAVCGISTYALQCCKALLLLTCVQCDLRCDHAAALAMPARAVAVYMHRRSLGSSSSL